MVSTMEENVRPDFGGNGRPGATLPKGAQNSGKINFIFLPSFQRRIFNPWYLWKYNFCYINGTYIGWKKNISLSQNVHEVRIRFWKPCRMSKPTFGHPTHIVKV